MNKFEGVFVSREILISDNLTTKEKIILAVLKNNIFDEMVTNQTLADFFNMNRVSMSRLISSIEKKGYIKTEIIHNYEVEVHEDSVKTTVRKITVL